MLPSRPWAFGWSTGAFTANILRDSFVWLWSSCHVTLPCKATRLNMTSYPKDHASMHGNGIIANAYQCCSIRSKCQRGGRPLLDPRSLLEWVSQKSSCSNLHCPTMEPCLDQILQRGTLKQDKCIIRHGRENYKCTQFSNNQTLRMNAWMKVLS